jgi:hypothetical protein
MVKPGSGMGWPVMGAEVVSGIVSQSYPDNDGLPAHIGYIAFCATSPSIEGVCAVAEFFGGDDDYAYGLAVDFVFAQRQIYERVLHECLKSCIWVEGHPNA